VIFGAISDRYGRKWPLIVNLLLCALFELGSGFANDFHTFLAVRSLFGITMGGIWGLAAATALENLPVEVRGLASGVIQQGYALGYLIAAVINLYLVPHTSWRALFWTSAGVSAFTAFLRILTPESAFFLQARDAERHRIAQDGAPRKNKTRIFIRETKAMLKNHWKLFIYAALLMAGRDSRLLEKSIY
jgi:MFS transporter, SHS family, lactate transporter